MPQVTTRVELPEEASKLPGKARELVTELVAFARWLVVHHRYHGAAQVNFHAPQWLIAQALGVHEDSVRRYLKHPQMARFVRAIPHYTDGYYHRIVTGKVWAVVIEPTAGVKPRIAFERERVLRDLEQDAAHGRVRGSYNPLAKGLRAVLQEWYLSSGAVPQEELQAPVHDARRSVDKLWEALRQLREKRNKARVTLAAKAIQAFTRDREKYLPGWCALLWRTTKNPRTYDYFCAVLARHSDAPGSHLGRKLLLELRETVV